MDSLDQLRIWYGEVATGQARVYAELPNWPADGPAASLSGVLEGPFCQTTRTLTARIPFRPQAHAGRLLGEALLPDPCLWNSELPHLYRTDIRLEIEGEETTADQRWFGLRPLGTREKRLYWQDRNWVLRAARPENLSLKSLKLWADPSYSTTVLIDDEDGDGGNIQELLLELSRQGVLTVVTLRGGRKRIVERLWQFNALPTVALVVLKPSEPIEDALRGIAPNLVLAERFAPGEPLETSTWAQVAVCEDDDPARLVQQAATADRPVIALRREGSFASPSQARRQCDLLQRELAGQGEFCGFVIDEKR